MESTAASRLPKALAEYHGLWPEVDLRITTGTARALAEAVLARELDCALVAESNAWPLDPGLESTRVGSEELLMILPATHPAVRKPQDVRIGTLASFSLGCTYRDIAQAWLGSAGERRPQKVLEVASYHAILACVAAGTCVGVLPRSVLELQRDAPELRIHPLMSVDTLLVRRVAYSTSAYEAFAGVLREQAW
jgi:DNA-binding transcriptional LysR family regulator